MNTDLDRSLGLNHGCEARLDPVPMPEKRFFPGMGIHWTHTD
jgi:hypothetical protein